LSAEQWRFDEKMSEVYIRFAANELGTFNTCHGPMTSTSNGNNKRLFSVNVYNRFTPLKQQHNTYFADVINRFFAPQCFVRLKNAPLYQYNIPLNINSKPGTGDLRMCTIFLMFIDCLSCAS